MRFVLAICIITGCTLCGRSLANGVRRRIELLEELCQGLRLLRLHMTSMFEAVSHALTLSNSAILMQVGEAMQPGISANGAWAAVCRREARRGGKLDALVHEDRQALDRLFQHLGESGRDAQELMLDAAIRALDYNLESARSRASEAERLYLSLGLLIGLMLALIAI